LTPGLLDYMLCGWRARGHGPRAEATTHENMTYNLKPFITPEEIEEMVWRLADRISADYAGRTPVLVGILKGAFVFIADLARAVEEPVEVDFIQAASYGLAGAKASEVRIVRDVTTELAGRDVILVEGIIDHGHTVFAVMKHIERLQPASIRLCTLLARKHDPPRMVPGLDDAYVGRWIDPGFIVGYGMDHAELCRELAGIYLYEDDA